MKRNQSDLRSQVITQLEKLISEDTDLAVRTRVLWAQQAINNDFGEAFKTADVPPELETSHGGEERRKE